MGFIYFLRRPETAPIRRSGGGGVNCIVGCGFACNVPCEGLFSGSAVAASRGGTIDVAKYDRCLHFVYYVLF